MSLSNEEKVVILRAADKIVAQGGRSLLAKILKGSKDKKILELGLQACSSYGYYASLTLAQVTEKIDWMIHYDFLEIEYSGKLPLLVFTERGWAIVEVLWAEQLLQEWNDWLSQGMTEVNMSYLKDRNRGMIMLFLDKIKETGDRKYIPYLQQWHIIDYKKVQQAILETIKALENGYNQADFYERVEENNAQPTLEMTELQTTELESILLKCWECGERFIFEVAEQKFYKSKGFNYPKRCPVCKEHKWYREMGIELNSEEEL